MEEPTRILKNEFQYFNQITEVSNYFRHKKVVIYIPFLSNRNYFDYLLGVIELLHDAKSEVHIVDSPYTFGLRENQNGLASEMRRQYLQKLNVPIYKMSHLEKDLPSRSDLKKHTEINQELLFSLSSVIASQYLRSESVSIDTLLKLKESRRYLQSYLHARSSLTKLAKKLEFTDLIFFNGRWPDQVGCKQFASENNINGFHLEAGEPADNRFFLQPFQTTDNNMMSRYLKLSAENQQLDVKTLTEWSQNWLLLNRTDTKHNRFLPEKKLIEAHLVNQKKHDVVYFTSSMDEFNTNLGTDLRGLQDALREDHVVVVLRVAQD
jgi:hypothetical protein